MATLPICGSDDETPGGRRDQEGGITHSMQPRAVKAVSKICLRQSVQDHYLPDQHSLLCAASHDKSAEVGTDGHTSPITISPIPFDGVGSDPTELARQLACKSPTLIIDSQLYICLCGQSEVQRRIAARRIRTGTRKENTCIAGLGFVNSSRCWRQHGEIIAEDERAWPTLPSSSRNSKCVKPVALESITPKN